MVKNPGISIIVSIYNAEAFLPRLLLDIKNQTFENFECLLINDGSTDSSSFICHSFASTDSRFRVIDKQNEGVSEARNKGIEESKGQFITFIDSDDRINPLYLEYLIAGLKDDVDVVICKRKIIFKHNRSLQKKLKNKMETEKCDFCSYLTNIKVGLQTPSYVWGHLYRKDRINNLFRNTAEVGFEDCYFNIENIANFRKVSFIYVPLYYYLVREGSLCKTRNKLQKNIILSAKALFALCDSIEKDTEKKEKLSPYIFHTIASFSYLIFTYSLQKEDVFVSDYKELIPVFDRYYSYWKQNKYRMEGLAYKVLWGSVYKYTKRKIREACK